MKRGMTTLVVLGLVSGIPAFSADEPVIGGPCDGCEHVFVDQPAELTFTARIAPMDEPGEAMLIVGTVRNPEGNPVPGIIVYAYHTNAEGIYPRGKTQHGRLRAWVRTDANGRYQFRTIRPGSYPGRDSPQHVHMHIIEPGQATYYIDDILFSDDPLLIPAKRRDMLSGRGGDGLANPEKNEDGVWVVRRDIVLRQGVSR